MFDSENSLTYLAIAGVLLVLFLLDRQDVFNL
jgi:hypothetical protein